MSVKIEPASIAEQLVGREFLYLITNNHARSHVVALRPDLVGDEARFVNTGRTPLANVALNSAVTLTWPPCDPSQTHEHAKYSVVADGVARLDGEVIVVTITNAVLHRPA